MDATVRMPDGRIVGYATYGPERGSPVLWCHGGPGSRLEPASFEPYLEQLGLRVVAIDRPGYGLSTLRPGRSIADWVPDAIAVLDALEIERCIAVGISTGGAYAFALAALAPARVRTVIACCAMTDMRYQPARCTMHPEHALAIWDAPDRAAAIEFARDLLGDDGSKFMTGVNPGDLCAADMEFIAAMADDSGHEVSMQAMFANGVEAYVDDRRADGVGWVSFDVGAVTCPVVVVHGSEDTVVNPVHAHHTVSVIPQAKLQMHEGLGHMSVVAQIVAPLLAIATTP